MTTTQTKKSPSITLQRLITHPLTKVLIIPFPLVLPLSTFITCTLPRSDGDIHSRSPWKRKGKRRRKQKPLIEYVETESEGLYRESALCCQICPGAAVESSGIFWAQGHMWFLSLVMKCQRFYSINPTWSS